MFGHSHTPAGITPVATSASHPSRSPGCTSTRRLRVRYERLADIHEAFLQIAGCLTCLELLDAENSNC
jgi:hypothetical protein